MASLLNKKSITNHQTLLHVLPSLLVLSRQLMVDIATGEAIEVLHRRFNSLVDNVAEMSAYAMKIDYRPQHSLYLFESLDDLLSVCREIQTYQNDMGKEVSYGCITDAYRNVHLHLTAMADLAENLEHISEEEKTKEQKPASPIAACA